MNILGNIMEVRQKILDEGQGSQTAVRLRRKAIDAIHAGSSGPEWVEYMKEFAKTPEELARLTAKDNSANDQGMNDARAYLVAKAPCGTDTVTTFPDTITGVLDGQPVEG